MSMMYHKITGGGGKTASHKSLIKCYKNFTSNQELIFIAKEKNIYIYANKYKCALTKINISLAFIYPTFFFHLAKSLIATAIT